MTLEKVLKELEKCGTMQNRKIYRRHGVKGELFGVSFANLNVLKRKIRLDHDMAMELWATENHDARVLATMIARPERMKPELLENLIKDLDNYIVTDAFAGLASRTDAAREKMENWMTSVEEWIGRAGWQMLAILAMRDPDLPDDYFEARLAEIEVQIHERKNRVRDAMNSALIAIGIRNEALKEKAIAAAGRIGKVEVDHGETDCQTFDAIPYIENAWERKNQTEK